MDSVNSLFDLCDLYGCTLETLCVSCLVCKSNLSYQDLLAFIVKNLKVVYRNFAFHAACTSCLKLTALHEQRLYCQCTASAAYVQYVCNGDIASLNVRCVTCMKQLDCIEKLDCIQKEQTFFLIRSIWRCFCRLCQTQDAW